MLARLIRFRAFKDKTIVVLDKLIAWAEWLKSRLTLKPPSSS